MVSINVKCKHFETTIKLAEWLNWSLDKGDQEHDSHSKRASGSGHLADHPSSISSIVLHSKARQRLLIKKQSMHRVCLMAFKSRQQKETDALVN